MKCCGEDMEEHSTIIDDGKIRQWYYKCRGKCGRLTFGRREKIEKEQTDGEDGQNDSLDIEK